MTIRSLFRSSLVVFAVFSLALAGCWTQSTAQSTASSRSIRSLAIQDNMLWLCGPNRVERLNLSDNSVEHLSPPQFSCEHLLTAKNRRVWAYRGSTILYYDGTNWHKPQIPVRYYLGFLSETSDGTLWFSSGLLSRYDPLGDQSEIIIPAQPTPDSSRNDQTSMFSAPDLIGPVFEAADGILWFNVQKRGVVRWDRKSDSRQFWGPNDGFDGLEPIPTKFIEAHDRSIWVGTLTGVYRFHDNAWQSWKLPEEDSHYSRKLNDFWVFDMLEDQQGRIWVVFARAGVMVWDGSQWNKIGNLRYPHDDAESIFQSSSGEIWIGFTTRGVAKYESGSLKDYSTNIRAFLETPDHRLFGGGAEGLFLYDRQLDKWEPYPDK